MYDVIPPKTKATRRAVLETFLYGKSFQVLNNQMPQVVKLLKGGQTERDCGYLAYEILRLRLDPGYGPAERYLEGFAPKKEREMVFGLLHVLFEEIDLNEKVWERLQNIELYLCKSVPRFEQDSTAILNDFRKTLKMGQLGVVLVGLGLNLIENRYYHPRRGMIDLSTAQEAGGGSIKKGFETWKKKVDELLMEGENLLDGRLNKIEDKRPTGFAQKFKEEMEIDAGGLNEVEYLKREREWNAYMGSNSISELPDYGLKLLNFWAWWTNKKGWRFFAYPREYTEDFFMYEIEGIGFKDTNFIKGDAEGWISDNRDIFVAFTYENWSNWQVCQRLKEFKGIGEEIGSGTESGEDEYKIVTEGEGITGVAWDNGELWALWKKKKSILGWEYIQNITDIPKLMAKGRKRELFTKPVFIGDGSTSLEELVRKGLGAGITL